MTNKEIFVLRELREQAYGYQGKHGGEGVVRGFGINVYLLLYLKWIANKVLLYV